MYCIAVTKIREGMATAIKFNSYNIKDTDIQRRWSSKDFQLQENVEEKCHSVTNSNNWEECVENV